MKFVFPLYLRVASMILAVTNVLASGFNMQVPRYVHWAVGLLFIACLLAYLVSVIKQRHSPPI